MLKLTLSPETRRGLTLIRLLVGALLLVLAARFVFQPDMRDDLRRADRYFSSGQYHAALQEYASLSARYDTVETALRLGMVRTVRGEYDLAERALRRAMALQPQGDQRSLTALYLGQVLERRGQRHDAALWARAADCPAGALCPYAGPQRIVRAEWALQQGDYAAAESDYRAALDRALPADWHALAVYRLALLQGARDPAAALALLTTTPSPSQWPDPFLTPLLPSARAETDQLQTVLQADPAQRPQLLGQFYLDRNLYGLAEAQFAQVAPDDPNALAAAAYAAYTRWRAGETRVGLQRLEALVAAHPDNSRARTLLALAYLSAEDTAAAWAQLDVILDDAPGDPDTHLVWANWYVAQRDYINARDEYQRALLQAPPDERGAYALLVAQFHLNTTYELCDAGLIAAELAVRSLPASADAWTTLAGSRYQCGDFAGAAEAARNALDRTASAAAAFYLGAALNGMGDRAAARQVLVRAADMAPASIWRERAEAALAHLPAP